MVLANVIFLLSIYTRQRMEYTLIISSLQYTLCFTLAYPRKFPGRINRLLFPTAGERDRRTQLSTIGIWLTLAATPGANPYLKETSHAHRPHAAQFRSRRSGRFRGSRHPGPHSGSERSNQHRGHRAWHARLLPARDGAAPWRRK